MNMFRIKTYGNVNAIVDSILDEIFDGSIFNDDNTTNDTIKAPIHDVIEKDNNYIIELLLAGVKKEDVSIETENNKLIIKAERKVVDDKDIKYLRNQSYKGKYERIIILPDDVDNKNIEATMENGILSVTIPKTTINKKKVNIK